MKYVQNHLSDEGRWINFVKKYEFSYAALENVC